MEIWYQRPISRDGVVDTSQDFPEILLIKNNNSEETPASYLMCWENID